MSLFDRNYLNTPTLDYLMLADKESLSGLYFATDTIFFKNRTIYNGTYVYLSSGEIHNSLGPAIIVPNSLYYFHHGTAHREGGPAIIHYDRPLIWNGSEWSFEGERRIIEEAYVEDGFFHRLDGPAHHFPQNPSNNRYIIRGKGIAKRDFKSHPEVQKQMVLDLIKNS